MGAGADGDDALKTIQNDPKLSIAAKQADLAAMDAVNKGQDPVKAAQMAVIKADVPSNMLGHVLPKDTLAKMKKKMKKK